jgi:hypothetical protein
MCRQWRCLRRLCRQPWQLTISPWPGRVRLAGQQHLQCHTSAALVVCSFLAMLSAVPVQLSAAAARAAASAGLGQPETELQPQGFGNAAAAAVVERVAPAPQATPRWTAAQPTAAATLLFTLPGWQLTTICYVPVQPVTTESLACTLCCASLCCAGERPVLCGSALCG